MRHLHQFEQAYNTLVKMFYMTKVDFIYIFYKNIGRNYSIYRFTTVNPKSTLQQKRKRIVKF